MHKDQVVDRKKMNGFNFYFAKPKPVYDPLTPPEVKFHGFTIKREKTEQLNIDRIGTWKQEIYLTNGQFTKITNGTHKVGISNGERLGEVKFQHEGGTLMVYYGGTGRPLCKEEFKLFCGWLGTSFGCDVLRDGSWGLSQLGVGVDGQQIMIDRFDKKGWKGCVTIADALGNVMRMYDKTLDNGEEGVRIEHHVKLEGGENSHMTLEAAMALMQGNVSSVGAANQMAVVSTEIRSLGRKLDNLVGSLNQVVGVLMETIKGIKSGG